jgi:hypothetical protein
MDSLNSSIENILNYQRDTEQTIKNMVDKNARLTKAIATIRSLLERSLKNPSNLNAAVYQSIDVCRANFIYTDYSTGKTKQDPPLADTEKTLPLINS